MSGKQREVVEAFIRHDKNKTSAASSLGMARTTFRNILKRASKNPEFKELFKENEKKYDDLLLKSQIYDLRSELNKALKKNITSEQIKKYIYEIKDSNPIIPSWVCDANTFSRGVTGVPSLALSDWHWGEVIDKKQIMGVNTFGLDVAHKRAQKIISGAIDVAFNHIARPNYPGLVVHLLGDMIAGLIHEELTITAEKEVLQAQLDIHGVLIKCFDILIEKLIFAWC